MSPFPKDHVIEVLTRQDGRWVRARWNDGRFVVDGEGSDWLWPEAVEHWREPVETTDLDHSGLRPASPKRGARDPGHPETGDRERA